MENNDFKVGGSFEKVLIQGVVATFNGEVWQTSIAKIDGKCFQEDPLGEIKSLLKTLVNEN